MVDFAKLFAKDPYFAFAFYTELTHDDINAARYMDDLLLDTLENLHANSTLNNTVLFVFGDHGIRFGEIRNTKSGKLEERLPYLTITFPLWFRKKYPDHYAN